MAQEATRITDFITAFPKAGARPNLFKVEIVGKGKAFLTDAKVTDQQYLLCQGASLPASELSSIPVSFMGRQIKLPGTRTFADLTLTFYNDEDMNLRVGFENWCHEIQQFGNVFGNKVRIDASSSIIADLKVTQLGKEGNHLRRYVFHSAFPTNVSDIALSYGDTDTIEQFTVNMAYQFYDIEETATPKLVDTGASDTSAVST